jgi:UDP-N-acetyl-D-mannosaminuronic acid transferase (WecB/TagA/CpsF family)
MSAGDPVQFQRILGIRFYNGDARGAVDLISENGGVLVAPAAPALKNIPHNPGYREALDDADLAIADSAFMVLIWNLTGGPRMAKLSGLKYLRCLVEQPHFRAEGSSFWVMPSARAATLSRRWLDGSGIAVDEDNLYVAPLYSDVVADPTLLQVLDKRQPRHIVLGIGGGTQEQLGLYLKRNLSYRPAIHCIGAAIGFLTGDEVSIPVWADALGLGWLWRCCSNPRQNIARYWDARHLATLMLRYRERPPAGIAIRTAPDLASKS